MKNKTRSTATGMTDFYTFPGCDTGELPSKEIKLRVPACWSSRFNVYLDQVPEFEELSSNLLRALIYSGMVNLDRKLGEQGQKDGVWELRKLGEQIIEKVRARKAMLDEIQEALAALPGMDRADATAFLSHLEHICDQLSQDDRKPVSAALHTAREAMKL